MKPLVKYQGGKTRELKIISKMMPKEFNRVVEPFCGGAALSFSCLLYTSDAADE